MKTNLTKQSLKKATSFMIFIVILGFTSSNVFATTYYTVANGAWGAAIWNAGNTSGAGSVLPALNAGDILVIDDQVTIASTTITINPAITIKITTTSATAAELIFATGGKLALTSASSVINMTKSSSAFPNPQINGSGSGASNTIKIGGNTVWQASDPNINGTGSLNSNSSSGVLPITLVSFSAVQTQKSTELKWSTASERNFNKFIVERSADGLSFESIGEIKGAGDSKAKLDYSYSDQNPLIGKSYYRLKSTDLDGSFEYSKVIFSDFDGAKEVRVYPNPSSGESIHYTTNFDPQANDNVVILDFFGATVATAVVDNTNGEIVFSTPLKSGAYFIKYVSSQYQKIERFVVK